MATSLRQSTIRNCVTAVVTPMTSNRELDLAHFRNLLDFQRKYGVEDIVVNGTTGESPTTSGVEKRELILRALRLEAKVIAGCGTNDTGHTIHLTEEATREGATSVLLVDPYYNGPSSLEIMHEYYEPVLSRFEGTEFIAYTIPGRTGCALSAEHLAELHQRYPNLTTVKEATGDPNLNNARKIRALSNIAIMSGDDPLTFKMMVDETVRAAGVISVISNIVPQAVQQLCRSVGDFDDDAHLRSVLDLQSKLAPLFELVTVKVGGEKFRNPVPIKTIMAGLGMISYSVRQPLGRMTKEAVDYVRNVLTKVWEDSPELLRPIQEFYAVDIAKRLERDENWIHY